MRIETVSGAQFSYRWVFIDTVDGRNNRTFYIIHRFPSSQISRLLVEKVDGRRDFKIEPVSSRNCIYTFQHWNLGCGVPSFMFTTCSIFPSINWMAEVVSIYSNIEIWGAGFPLQDSKIFWFRWSCEMSFVLWRQDFLVYFSQGWSPVGV